MYKTNGAGLKKVLIIYPHLPPSNLAGVHRPRLFALHLREFGWDPVMLTVHEKFYEEALDWDLVKLMPEDMRIEKVDAYPLTKPRLIGDIGLRAFFQLYRRAKQILKEEKIDFIFIPIPSFYSALLGRMLHGKTGVPYGIDYIDPWVHKFPGSDTMFSRHWFSTKLAEFLEPIAVKKVSLITGVAEGYYLPVLERNPELKGKLVHGAMPYGGEIADHRALKLMTTKPYLFEKNKNKFQFVYAGAMLPKAYEPLCAIFESIKNNPAQFSNVEFHFIGTGSRANDAASFNIRKHAEAYGLWNTIVFEYPKRIPYLDVLLHLNIADAILVLGSTEAHYTPSKTYQAVLSGKPLLAVLHRDSTAVNVIRQSNAGVVLAFAGGEGIHEIRDYFKDTFQFFREFAEGFDPAQVDMKVFDLYSARNVTMRLAELFDKALDLQK